MITSALLTRYRIQEFIQFMHNTLVITRQHGPDKLRIKTQHQLLGSAYQRLEQTYKQNAASEITSKIAEWDNRRDQAIICLRMISEGYTRHPQPALRASGQQVMECINKYGPRLYQLNYSAETTALKNIVRDLRATPACAQAIRAMHLESVVSEIKRANTEFEKVFIQRLEESSQLGPQSTRELVQSTGEAYSMLTKHLEAHATLTPSFEYTLLINHLNENIEHFNQLVERRKPASESVAVDSTDEAVGEASE